MGVLRANHQEQRQHIDKLEDEIRLLRRGHDMEAGVMRDRYQAAVVDGEKERMPDKRCDKIIDSFVCGQTRAVLFKRIYPSTWCCSESMVHAHVGA